MRDPVVSIIVINRNTKEFLKEFLESLESENFSGELEVWVVDNNSSDGSPALVLESFPQVHLIWNTRNEGYARACNKGIKVSRGEFIIFSNSDVSLEKGAIKEILDCFRRNPDAGIVGPLVLNPDGTVQLSCREFPSIKEAFMHAFLGFIHPSNPFTQKYRKAKWEHDREVVVDWVSGAFLAARRSALESIGGFDEKYYMYVEDVDLCWRMREAGWKVYFTPKARVTHFIGKSSEHANVRMLFHHHKSMFRFHRKTYKGPAKFLVDLLVGIGVALRFALIMLVNFFRKFRGAEKIMPGKQ